MQVNIYVEEGSVSRIKEINIVGNKLYEKEDLLELFKLKVTNLLSWYNKDDRYSKQVLSGDLEGLRSFYMDRGYLDFKINSSLIRISENKKHVYVDISIKEGIYYRYFSDINATIEINIDINETIYNNLNKYW